MTNRAPFNPYFPAIRRYRIAPRVCVIIALFGAFTLPGCSIPPQQRARVDSSSDQRIDAALKPFADVDFELKTVIIPKALEVGNTNQVEYLMYLGGVVRAQAILAAALEATGGKLDQILTDESAQDRVAWGWDRAKIRYIEWLKATDDFKGQVIEQSGGEPLDAQTALLESISRPTTRGEVAESLRKPIHLDDEEWSGVADGLRKRLPQEMWDALVAAQQKYDIQNQPESLELYTKPANWPKYSGELEGPIEVRGTNPNGVNGSLEYELTLGGMEVRVKNPNDFKVRVGLRSDGDGKDFTVAANDTESVKVPKGHYEIYFQYSTDPDGLYQGDSFTLNDNGVEIQIAKVVNGNYGIRKVK